MKRNELLAEAIPALSLPVGANPVDRFDYSSVGGINKNIDLKTFKTGWPSARSSTEDQKWHHSDFDYVAYPFTHSLFAEIVEDTNLK